MKILFLANRVPYPPFRGDKLKIYNLARRLKDRHELHLLTFAQTPEDLGYKAKLEEVFTQVHLVYLPKWRSALRCVPEIFGTLPFQVAYFKSGEMQGKLDELLQTNKYDAVHVQHLRMSPYLAANTEMPRILDLPDAFSLYWERRSQVKRGLLTRLFEAEEQKRVLKYEGVLKQYNMSLVCSAEDLEYLKLKHHTGNLRLLPNGVDLTTFKARDHDYAHGDKLLFTGNMDYAPNVDAVVHFVKHALPLIKGQYPQVRFIIAGQRPVKQVLELAGDGVEVTGFVPNLADIYDSASVVVAPLRFGAGTQNKVLEAMAMGVPVVCSHIGFAGLGIADGQGAFMRREPEAFAAAVMDLMANEELRRDTGMAGMKVIRERFDWDIVAEQLEGYLAEVVVKHGQAGK